MGHVGAAQVAKSYFTLRALDEQVLLTRETVRLREEALVLQKKRADGGVISEFEYRQLEAETAAVRAQLPPLERDREREEAALLVLLGRSPQQIFQDRVARRESQDDKPAAPVLPSGMPSQLLLRRGSAMKITTFPIPHWPVPRLRPALLRRACRSNRPCLRFRERW